MTAAGAFTTNEAQGQRAATNFVPAPMSYGGIAESIARQALKGPGRGWLYGFILTAIATAVLIGGFVWLFAVGIGIFGLNTTVVWGYAIANYVWWIGIGNAGTLISAL